MTAGILVNAHPLDGTRRQRPHGNLRLHQRKQWRRCARRVALSIYEEIASLSEFPERGRSGRKPPTRELILSGLPYVAVYRVQRDGVEILRILHQAQNWP